MGGVSMPDTLTLRQYLELILARIEGAEATQNRVEAIRLLHLLAEGVEEQADTLEQQEGGGGEGRGGTPTGGEPPPPPPLRGGVVEEQADTLEQQEGRDA